jgi:hypothetical protein
MTPKPGGKAGSASWSLCALRYFPYLSLPTCAG